MGGKLLKKRICSSRSKFFPLRVDPILEWIIHPGKQSKSHKPCFFFVIKMVDYKEVYTYTVVALTFEVINICCFKL